MTHHIPRNLALICLAFVTGLAIAAAPPPSTPVPPAAPDVWPREVKLSNAAILIYQPQVNSWVDNKIDLRSALAIKPDGAEREAFGVVFATAHTRIDKATRRVVLENLSITKSDFPTLADRGAAYAADLQKRFAAGVHSISLDSLKQSPALAGTAAPAAAVLNNVPRVIISQSPAILVPIDGAPVLRPLPNNSIFKRVINTKALILQRIAEKDFYIHVFDGWLMANSIQGPWTLPFIPPKGLPAIAKAANATHLVDMLDGGPNANPKPSLANGVPTIYTSQVPTELIVFKGQPDFVPIIGTSLLWAANTTSDVLVDTASKDYFVLLAGRWFRGGDLNGQWTFVAGNALPPDFANIPPTSLAGAVLQTVAGTAQAKQALNENSIAQTATVPRKNGPTFAPKFDGAPQFAPIAGTSLTYVSNASAPIFRVAPDSFYAVSTGVWFTAAQVTGPWAVATSVPEAIYALPPSSPLYYTTYVRIYDVTPDAVHVGYTPGYLGTAVSPSGTVVYGTGYTYMSWADNVWYPAPVTYGVAATPVHNRDVGHTFAFAVGLGTPAWTAPYLPGAYLNPGYWGGYPCCGTAAANVYRRGNTAANANVRSPNVNTPGPEQMTRAGPQYNAGAGNSTRGYDQTPSPIAANPGRPQAANGATGRTPQWQPYSLPNVYYADQSGNVYRQDNGGWQQNTSSGWSAASGDTTWADQEVNARNGNDSAVAAASYGMSNADRFTGAPNTGWSAQDSGDGGYSRTLGGSGGISAEYDNYWNQVQSNAIDMWWNGGWYGGGNIYYSGIGWSSRFP